MSHYTHTYPIFPITYPTISFLGLPSSTLFDRRHCIRRRASHFQYPPSGVILVLLLLPLYSLLFR